MNWDDLRFVLEIAREGSIMAASKTLRVAHTTVSRRLQALERAHGVQLFERRGNVYHPTLVAEGLVEIASEMDTRIGSLERQLAAQAHEPRVEGEVRIATAEGLAERLGAHLVDFRERYPELRLRLCVSNEMVSLAKGEADVAIRITRTPPDRLVGRKLADVRFAVYGAATMLPEPVGDIHELPWVCRDTSESPQGRWEAQHVDADRVVLRTNALGLFLDAVRHGMGIGILPRAVAEPTLVQLSDLIDELSLPMWILTHADLRNTARVRAVIDYFAEVTRQHRE